MNQSSKHDIAGAKLRHDEFPATAWTRIAAARDPTSHECQASISVLATLYERPLLQLFRFRLNGLWKSEAEDWSHDFIVSHLLTGKIFVGAKPGGRFRNYLAVAARNYIYSRLRRETAPRGSSTESHDGHEVVDGDSLADDEAILSRERAHDCFNVATTRVERWGKLSGDREKTDLAIKLRNKEVDLKCLPKRGSAARDVVDKFKEFLLDAVREELIVRQGENPQDILEREIAILLDALIRPPLDRVL